MTKLEICKVEESNTGKVYLYQEGLFYKAYERSAYILCVLVHPFKVSARELKGFDGLLLSVGFPQTSLEKFAGEHKVSDNPYAPGKVIEVMPSPDLSGFALWKGSFRKSAPDNLTTAASVQRSQSPVYADAYRLVLETTTLCCGLDRRFRYSLGEDIRLGAKRVLLHITWALKGEDRIVNIAAARHDLSDVQLCLRLLNDMKVISDKRYVPFLEMTESIAKQLSNWERSERRRSSAAGVSPPL